MFEQCLLDNPPPSVADSHSIFVLTLLPMLDPQGSRQKRPKNLLVFDWPLQQIFWVQTESLNQGL